MTAISPEGDILNTARLRLVPACHALVGDALAGAGSLAELMGLDVPAGVETSAYDATLLRQAQDALQTQDDADWPFYYVVADLGRGPRLAGVVGYKGALSPVGSVEIGYFIRADLQGFGIATEAAEALVQRAFADGRVNAVIAETLADLASSVRVLTKLGFTEVGGGSAPEVMRFERRRAPVGPATPSNPRK